MIENCRKSIEFVLKNEGGFTIDNGGPTNYGITAKYLTSLGLVKKYDRNSNGVIDEEDMRNFTREDAIDVYKLMFVNGRYYLLKDINILMRVFDCAVNSGDHQSILLLQRSINSLDPDSVDVDGILGSYTATACNEYPEKKLLVDTFKYKRKLFHTMLAENNPEKYEKDLKGWLKRDSL